ncbi:MAG: hypothetical protein R2769_11785 [Saprospiraceae bacterium]
MMKNPFLFVFVGSLFLLSCEGGTTFTKEIINNSEDTLKVSIYSLLGSPQEFRILPGASEIVFWNDRLGSFVDETYNCLEEIDSFKVIVSGNKILEKDLMEISNWVRSSKDGRNSEENCRFTVSIEDIK